MRLVVFVADIGAPVALHQMLSELPADFSIPMLVLQPTENLLSESAMAALRRTMPFEARPIGKSAALRSQCILIGQPQQSYRPAVVGDELRVNLGSAAASDALTQTIDELAQLLGSELAVVFLTGRAEGVGAGQLCRLLVSHGCEIIVLHREEAVLFEIGAAALQASDQARELTAVAAATTLRAAEQQQQRQHRVERR